MDGINTYPKAFTERIITSGEKIGSTVKSGRAFNRGYDITTSGLKREVMHELAHVYENIPQVRGAERDFYEMRTQGEPYERLSALTGNSAYADWEVSRPDHFFDPYCGKDYGGRNYELASMGIEKFSKTL